MESFIEQFKNMTIPPVSEEFKYGSMTIYTQVGNFNMMETTVDSLKTEFEMQEKKPNIHWQLNNLGVAMSFDYHVYTESH